MNNILLRLTAALLCCAALLLSGCSPDSEIVSENNTPERVAVLFSSLAEIWLDAGGEIAVTVGETVERGFAPEGTPLVDDGAGKTVNLELLISLEPDFVICSADIPAQAEAAKVLESAGIPTMLCRVESFGDYLTTLEAMTRITGQSAAYEARLVLQEEIDSILSDAQSYDSCEILFVRAGSTASSTKAKLAEDHFACAMLEELGCRNIAEDASVLLDGLSMEAILLADPDYIFFSLMGNAETAAANVQSLLDSDAWGRLAAVQNGKVTILPKELFHYKPCGRWADAYRFLADVLQDDAS